MQIVSSNTDRKPTNKVMGGAMINPLIGKSKIWYIPL